MHEYLGSELLNRELSWLSFNERVLDEAADPTVPLIERLRFLGIYSNNQDEFFRVRVASMRRLVQLGKASRDFPEHDPGEILEKIQEKVLKLQEKFSKIYSNCLIELQREKIDIIDHKQLTAEEGEFVLNFFTEVVSAHIVPLLIAPKNPFPDLKDKTVYLAVKLTSKKNNKLKIRYALIEVPVNERVSRFIVLPDFYNSGRVRILLLDDLIRYCLDEIFFMFEYDEIQAYTIKVTRDAEIDIDDDISKSLVEKMTQGLQKRQIGRPVRFVYDKDIDRELLSVIIKGMGISKLDLMIPGGRYHNFKDYINFPAVKKELLNQNPPQLFHPEIDRHKSILNVIRRKDVMVHYPYHTFNHLIDFLREAAVDPKVKSIKITLYRLAKSSKVINALINAAKNGKEVIAVIELLARFDEKANIKWSSMLQEAGVKVIQGIPGLKVHAKLALVVRIENGVEKLYSYIGTGNFNEDTATLYCDEGLFTTNVEIGNEINKVFEFLKDSFKRFNFKHLIVAPYGMRKRFKKLIDNEIENCRQGKPAYIHLKINNLVDENIIKHLYYAATKGVEIKLIVRGMCSLKPDMPELNGKIQAISIIDKYLEHSRFVIFANGGNELYYLTSADWMIRNFDYRVEVACPVYNPKMQQELRTIFDIQWSDNQKARIIDRSLLNPYKQQGNQKPVRAQVAIYEYLKQKTRPI
ncbi:MAG TPA: polyphosphate kinase 1 [Salinivirgaceae bacterium]|nr:polyphosphate kinase 1 [Salinivirgaceae bacterium]